MLCSKGSSWNDTGYVLFWESVHQGSIGRFPKGFHIPFQKIDVNLLKKIQTIILLSFHYKKDWGQSLYRRLFLELAADKERVKRSYDSVKNLTTTWVWKKILKKNISRHMGYNRNLKLYFLWRRGSYYSNKKIKIGTEVLI